MAKAILITIPGDSDWTRSCGEKTQRDKERGSKAKFRDKESSATEIDREWERERHEWRELDRESERE
jgi:hypothetical protein